jgi:hypothetical protein
LHLEQGTGLAEAAERVVHVPAGGRQVDRDLAGLGEVDELVRQPEVTGERRRRQPYRVSLASRTASSNPSAWVSYVFYGGVLVVTVTISTLLRRRAT